MFSFYKVIYSERAVNPSAAQIMAEEAKSMILVTKNLFYTL
jgi:transcriptional regulator